MEAQCSATDAEDTVVQRLTHMSLVDRMRLLKKYLRVIENQYLQSDLPAREALVLKIHRLKFSRTDLIASYVNRDPVVDVSGCRLCEFLEAELLP